jgi:hypothetical protein
VASEALHAAWPGSTSCGAGWICRGTDTLALESATMPSGQKYEDWLKDREGRKKDGEKE